MEGRSGSLSRRGRALGLVVAHCRSLDPDSLPARERLERALGPELARKLVGALVSRPNERRAA